jgi:LemA protein
MEMLLIIVAVVVVLALVVIGIYNGLVKLRNAVQAAASGIVVILKQRADMLPNLMEVVKGYAGHESRVFEEVAQARQQVNKLSLEGNGLNPAELAGAAHSFAGALSRLLAVSENYPELKANENFIALQNSIEHTEASLVQARRFYNGVVREYQNKKQVIPNVWVVQLFKMKFEDINFFEDEQSDELAKGLGTTDIKMQF